MKVLKENLVVQFSLISAVLIAAIALVIALLLTSKLDRNIELLREHGAAMMSGTTIKPSDPYSIPSLASDVEALELRSQAPSTDTGGSTPAARTCWAG